MKLRKTMKHAENKGFSLVELIIVIAIMAVLVGVLTPAYLKYVERSRQSADVQSIDAIMSAMEVVAIDPMLNIGADTKMEASFENDGKMTIKVELGEGDTTTNVQNVSDNLKELIGEYTLKTAAWNKLTVSGTADGNGNLTFKFGGGKELAEAVKAAGNFGSKVTVEGDTGETN